MDIDLLESCAGIDQEATDAPRIRQVAGNIVGVTMLSNVVVVVEVDEALGARQMTDVPRAGSKTVCSCYILQVDGRGIRRVGHQHLVTERPIVVHAVLGPVDSAGKGVAFEYRPAEP